MLNLEDNKIYTVYIIPTKSINGGIGYTTKEGLINGIERKVHLYNPDSEEYKWKYKLKDGYEFICLENRQFIEKYYSEQSKKE